MSTVAASTQASSPQAARSLSYVQAFNEAVHQCMADDPTVFCAGEDVGAHGGVFHNFDGLQAAYGEKRAVDTPISEQAIIGLGIGAAATGLRPIVDLMFMDFVLVAADQIVNQAAKMKYMYGGNIKLPLTITTMGGAGLSAAAQHSQSLEAMLISVPGLMVAYPSNPYDMKGLMISCIREDNPTFMVLHKRLLGVKDAVPEERYSIPFGSARIARAGRTGGVSSGGSGAQSGAGKGPDVTVVAWGRMVAEALLAAEVLAAEGIDCEVIDPRTLLPFDTESVVASARRSHRVVIVHEAVRSGGFGAEIASRVQEEAFDYLDAPVGRIAAPFSPVPFSPVLEQIYLPDAARIAEGIRATVGRRAPGS
jgi:acetoin:2,6-dichlorophenolindophenol oxidoreductase subunit beta